jgi:hypothetical protein
MGRGRNLLALVAGIALAAPSAAPAHPNGYGPDADGDSNPATNTRLFARIGDAAEAALDPPFRVLTFEPPPGANNDPIGGDYFASHGVKFSPGLVRQICEGQRYRSFDSLCTYMRAPSGKYAALYSDEKRRPLNIQFAQPVCAAALALYPTGGAEDEPFEITLQSFDADEKKLPAVKHSFSWTNDTFRWRLMVGAYFVNGAGAADKKASRIEVSVKSLGEGKTKKNVRFLIDDVAYVSDGCSVALADIAAETAPSAAP